MRFAILRDRPADTHVFLPSTGAHSPKFVTLTLGFTNVRMPKCLIARVFEFDQNDMNYYYLYAVLVVVHYSFTIVSGLLRL